MKQISEKPLASVKLEKDFSIPSKRYLWIDAWKGILIMGIVIGHTGLRYLTPLFYLFHVAAFFFVSGLTTNFEKDAFKDFMIKRFNRLIIPFVTINFIFLTAVYSLKALGYADSFGYSLTSFAWLNVISLKTVVDLAGATWFLPVMFFGSMISYLVFNFSRSVNKKGGQSFVVLGSALLLFFLAYTLTSNKIYSPTDLDLAMIAAFYLLLGNITKSLINLNEPEKNKYFLPAIAVAALALIYFYSQSTLVNWPTRAFNHPFSDILQTTSGILLTGAIAIFLSKINIINRAFISLGKASIAILAFHFLFFRILFVVLYKLNLVTSSQLKSLVPLYTDPILLGITAMVALVGSTVLYTLFKKNNLTSKLFNGEG